MADAGPVAVQTPRWTPARRRDLPGHLLQSTPGAARVQEAELATQREIDFTYGLADKFFRLSMGETGDFSCAKYDGDFSLTLEEAQKRKHCFVFEQLQL